MGIVNLSAACGELGFPFSIHAVPVKNNNANNGLQILFIFTIYFSGQFKSTPTCNTNLRRPNLTGLHCTKKRIYNSTQTVVNVKKIPLFVKFGHICSEPNFMFERDLRVANAPVTLIKLP